MSVFAAFQRGDYCDWFINGLTIHFPLAVMIVAPIRFVRPWKINSIINRDEALERGRCFLAPTGVKRPSACFEATFRC